MELSSLKTELSALSLFDHKNNSVLENVLNILDELINSETSLLDYYIQSEYDVLQNLDYLIINLLLDNAVIELSFKKGSYRTDILDLKTIKRIETSSYEAKKEIEKTIPPAYSVKLYHDAGPVLNSDGQSMGAVSTVLFASGNEIHKLKEFEKKIRKKIFNI